MSNEIHLDSFCEFWEMNFSTPIPPLPTKPNDLSVTQLELLRLFDGGKLYQNLFRITDPKKLPADLARNISKGLVDFQHKDLYRKNGWEFQAQQIEKSEAEVEQMKIDKEIAEMKKRNEEQQKINEAKSKMSLGERMMSEPLTQAQIINNQIKYHGHVGT